jgi:hypothetical protein
MCNFQTKAEERLGIHKNNIGNYIANNNVDAYRYPVNLDRLASPLVRMSYSLSGGRKF